MFTTLGLVLIGTLLCIFIRFSFSFLCFKRGRLSYLVNPYTLRTCAVGPSCHVLTNLKWNIVEFSVFRTTFSWYITNYKFLVHYNQRPCSSSNMSHLRMIRISFDQARAIAIQSAILYHTRTAKQILVKGTLEGINEAKCTQLLRMSLYRSCIHRENVSHCNWKKQYFKLKKLIHVLLTTCRLRI